MRARRAAVFRSNAFQQIALPPDRRRKGQPPAGAAEEGGGRKSALLHLLLTSYWSLSLSLSLSQLFGRRMEWAPRPSARVRASPLTHLPRSLTRYKCTTTLNTV